MHEYRHFLSIGGTGMLARATRALAQRSDAQTILARHARGFVARSRLARATGMDCDWRHRDPFEASLRAAVADERAVDLCVLWIHADGIPVVPLLLDILAATPCRLIHVLGSAAAAPASTEDIRGELGSRPNLVYHSVTLGSKRTSLGRRWLTDHEISAGVLECARALRDQTVGDATFA